MFLWKRLNSSFWFLPAVLTVASILLFGLTQYLDRTFGAGVSEQPLLFSGGADAARSVLGAISGGIITVTATSFSLAIVVLQLASSQYTPRVMQNFLADRGIQIVLGVYVGTFTYALLVLRIIRTSTGPTGAFVPVFSVAIAVLLALICVALLIYFIHHIADLIQSSTVVQSAHRDSLRTIQSLEDLGGEHVRGPVDERSVPEGEPLVLLSKRSGYVQQLEPDSMVGAVGGNPEDGGPVFVEVPSGPGFYVSAGQPLVRIWRAGNIAEEKVRESIVMGKERSFQQDFAFGLRQLSDIALLGLSPGVNDPTSAMQAMDRIEAILIALGDKKLPSRETEYEANGKKMILRVGHYGFDDVVGLGLDQIRRSAFTSGQVAVLDRFLELVGRAIAANESPERRRSLWERALAVARLAPQEITDPRDAINLVLHAIDIASPLLDTELRDKVGSDLSDLLRYSRSIPGSERVRQEIESALRD